jgi:hypothetical protein
MEGKSQPVPKVQNLVVARYQDGKMIRGVTHDFGPQKKVFHLSTVEKYGKTIHGKVFEIYLSELKAVFFVNLLKEDKGLPRLKDLWKKNWIHRA